MVCRSAGEAAERFGLLRPGAAGHGLAAATGGLLRGDPLGQAVRQCVRRAWGDAWRTGRGTRGARLGRKADPLPDALHGGRIRKIHGKPSFLPVYARHAPPVQDKKRRHRVGAADSQKASQSLRPQAQIGSNHFLRRQVGETPRAQAQRSAYVGENTSRPASWVRLQTRKLCAARLVKSNLCSAVEFLCRRRRNYARSRVQAPQTRAQRSGSRLSVAKILFCHAQTA